MRQHEHEVATARWVSTTDEHRLAALRRDLLAFAAARRRITADARLSIALAVDEALTNVARHAYPRGTAGPVTVAAAADDRHLSVHIRDHGCGAIDDEAHVGRGVRRLTALCHRFELWGEPGRGTWMLLEFDLVQRPCRSGSDARHRRDSRRDGR